MLITKRFSHPDTTLLTAKMLKSSEINIVKILVDLSTKKHGEICENMVCVQAADVWINLNLLKTSFDLTISS